MCHQWHHQTKYAPNEVGLLNVCNMYHASIRNQFMAKVGLPSPDYLSASLFFCVTYSCVVFRLRVAVVAQQVTPTPAQL